MPKELGRDLGLASVVAISMGAMIGSGIFILPGIAMAEAGPAVILAFILAAVLVLPAGLSIAELGTAMPEAGGDYIYIERGIGPMAGTIAGLGTWLMLMLKGALALFGGMFYLDVVMTLPSETAAAVVIGTILIAINVFGVKQTGQLQTVMVTIMVVILGGFVALTITGVEADRYEPFFDEGTAGLFTATATVLVSYAGVTKIAAAAEEVENPGRNLPLGLLLSLGFTTILYALIVFVIVGVVDAGVLQLEENINIPMVVVVEESALGFTAVVAIVLAAMFALISTANAGILTASRYPLALSRDDLLHPVFSRINDRFRTPVIAILVTGGAMLAFLVALDIEDIAKSAGSFQIIVYILVNVALVAFRERDLGWYDPDFRAPGYPWVQLFGVLSGIFIITQMDPLPIVGGFVLVVGGAIYYVLFLQDRVEREGIAVDVARRAAGRQAIEATQAVVRDADVEEVLVAVGPDMNREREEVLLRLVAPLVRTRGRISVVEFSEVPDQVPLGTVSDAQTIDDVEFEEDTRDIAEELDVEVVTGKVVTHDTKRAIVGYTERIGVDLLVTERETQGRLQTLLGRDADWILEHADCDTVFVQNRGLDGIEEIVVVTDRSPFNDPMKIGLANAIALEADARIRCLFVVPVDAPDSLVETIGDYHTELDELCPVEIESHVLRNDDEVGAIARETHESDLVMLSTVPHRRLDALLPARTDRIGARLEGTALYVNSRYARRHTFLRPILDTVLFRSGQPSDVDSEKRDE